jgi:hypothetical protein
MPQSGNEIRRPDRTGRVGRAWKLDDPFADGWLIDTLAFTPLVHSWVLLIADLRDKEGVEPATKMYPEAQFELIVLALDPREHPVADPDHLFPLHHLDPPDQVVQFHGMGDEGAALLLEWIARDVINGQLSPEPDFRPFWTVVVTRAAAGIAKGEVTRQTLHLDVPDPEPVGPPPPPPLQLTHPGALHTFDREFATEAEALDWLQAQGQTFPRLFLVGWTERRGLNGLMQTLESDLYRWGTPENADFQFVNLMWEGIPYTVLSLPEADRERVLAVMERTPPGFTVKWGEPHHFRTEGRVGLGAWREGGTSETDLMNRKRYLGATCFPLRGENVGTIEFGLREEAPRIVAASAMPPNRAERRATQRRKKGGYDA